MPTNPFSLAGKTIFITGASSGIGRSIAIEIAAMGGKVILTGRNKERLDDTMKMLAGEGHSCLAGDLNDNEFLEAINQHLVSNVDGVVLNAGVMKVLPVTFLSDEVIDKISDINYKAPLKITRNFLKSKKINAGASFVFITSIDGGVIGSKANSLYSSTKAGITGFAKSLATELGEKKIRFNCVAPGLIHTEGIDDISQMYIDNSFDSYINKQPLKRMGEPQDVAFAVIYLLSDASSWVTGTTLIVDGGFTSQ